MSKDLGVAFLQLGFILRLNEAAVSKHVLSKVEYLFC